MTDRLVEGLVSQIVTTQAEAAVMYLAVEEKRLKFMMEIEDGREEWEAKARSEERKQEEERRAEREVSGRLENRKHEERIMQMMLAMHQAPLAMQMPQSLHHLQPMQPMLQDQPVAVPFRQQYSAARQEVVSHVLLLCPLPKPLGQHILAAAPSLVSTKGGIGHMW